MNKLRVKTLAMSLVVAMVCVAVLPMAGTAQAVDRCEPLPPPPSPPYPGTEFGTDGIEVQVLLTPWWPGPTRQVTLEEGYSWGSIYRPVYTGWGTVAAQADTRARPKADTHTMVWATIKLYRWESGWQPRAEAESWTSTPGLCGNYDVDAHVRSPWVGGGWYRAVSTRRVFRNHVLTASRTQRSHRWIPSTLAVRGTAQAADGCDLPLLPLSDEEICLRTAECRANDALYAYREVMELMRYLPDHPRYLPHHRTGTEFGPDDGVEVRYWPHPEHRVQVEPGGYSWGEIYRPHGAIIPWWLPPVPPLLPAYYDWPGDVVGRTDTEARPRTDATTTKVWVEAHLFRWNAELNRWEPQGRTISWTVALSAGPDGDYDVDGYVGGPWLGPAYYAVVSVHHVYRDGVRAPRRPVQITGDRVNSPYVQWLDGPPEEWPQVVTP